MSEYSPGSFEFTDRIMKLKVAEAHREAEALRQAAAVRPRSKRLYCAILAGLGKRLVAWGSSLQESYSPKAPTRTSASRAA